MKTREEVCAFVRYKTKQAFNSWAINSGDCSSKRYLAWERIRVMLDNEGMSVFAVKHKVSCRIKANLSWIDVALKSYKTYKEHEEKLAYVNAETAELKGFMEFLENED